MPVVRGEAPEHAEVFAVPGMRHNIGQYYRRWATTRGNVNIVIRRDRWKGIWNVDRDSFELYDLRLDPLEQSNVESQNPKLVEAMRAYLKTWYERQSRSPEEAGNVPYRGTSQIPKGKGTKFRWRIRMPCVRRLL